MSLRTPFPIIVFLVCMLAGTPVLRALTITVTDTSDTSGAGTLRDAIAQANAAGVGTTVTINLPTNATFQLTSGTQLLLNTAATVQIVGNGSTLDGNSTTRIFQIQAGTVNLQGLTFQNGLVQGAAGGSTSHVNGGGGGGAAALGGAIYLTGGSLTLTSDQFATNTAHGGNGGSTNGNGFGSNGGAGGGGPSGGAGGSAGGGTGGNGGFGSGGGGGGGTFPNSFGNGGSGGFGGGGGGGGARAGGGSGGSGGAGGTLGGNGGQATASFPAGGGGGAGLGGAVFVTSGATLSLVDTSLTNDSAIGGAGRNAGASGSGLGSGLFLAGGTTAISLGAGSNQTISDTIAELPASPSALTVSGSGTLTLSGANTYSGGTTLQGGTLVLGNNSALGTGALTTVGNTVVYANGVTISNSIVMTGDTALEVDDGNSATQSGAISESGGVHSITKTGAGTLILTHANTYSGGTTINSGILEAEHTGALGTGNVTVGSGTSLQLTGGIALSNNITISGIGAGGAGAIFSTDGLPSNQVSGNVTLAADASVNNVSSPYALFIAGNIALGAHDLTLGGGGNILISGQITGTGGLTVTPNTIGFLNGSTANSYTGLTTVSAAAVLDIGKTSGPALAGNLDISGSVEDYLSNQLLATTVVTLSGNGLLNFRNQGTTETVAGLNGTNGTEITPFINGGGNTLHIAGSGNYSFAGRIDDKSPAGSGSSSVALVMQGSGTQVLTGASNYSGGTTISAGVLQLGDGFAAGASLGSGNVTVNGTGTFTLDLANNETFANHIIDNSHVILDDFASSDYTVSSFISGTGTVVKSGANTITVTGNNNYSGGTTVTAGTLVAGNVSAFGTGPLQVNGGILKMGNGNHTISINSYAQTGGTLYLTVAGPGQIATADLLHVTNTLASQASLGGKLTVNLASLTALTGAHPYTFTLVDTVAGYNGKFASFDPLGLGSGWLATLDYTTAPDDVLLNIFRGFALTGLTPNQQAVAANLNQNSGVSAHNINKIFTALQNLPLTSLPGAFDQLSPQQFGQFTSTTAINNASFETEAQDSYTAGQRSGPNGTFIGGNGGIDASGLTLNDPSYDPSLAMVHSRLLAWNPAPTGHMLSDMPGPMMAGIDVKDPKDMKSMAAPAYTNPWNFYVRGNVILAQGFSQTDVSHFDDNTASVVLGTDYRLTPNFLIGLTAGYGHTDVTLDNVGSSATVDSYSPGLYASYADKGWYANASGSYIHNAYTQSRVISFLGQTANSAPEGNEGVANLDGGYDFHHGALTFGPLAGVQYTHLTVDGYNETGSAADLSVNSQDADSLRSRLGGRVSFAFSHYGVNFTPHLDASWQHEFLDQSRGITSQFNGGIGSFSVRTTNPSRDSALIDAGLNAEINGTVTVFGDYMVQAGQENYFGQSVQAGVKIGF